MTRNESSRLEMLEAPASTSAQFAGRWHRLVSNTNWEKGRIILAWRTALQDEGATAAHWSDETWSTLVGGITPQHVGRLRRVFERFGSVYTTYPGLYWSHFCAALDWPDAEMWLEGAVQNGWSVSAMRAQRWQARGGLQHERPREEEVVAVEPLEDAATAAQHADETSRAILEARPQSEAPAGPDLSQGPDFGEEPSVPAVSATESLVDGPVVTGPVVGGPEGDGPEVGGPEVGGAGDVSRRPFAHLGELPADLQEALDVMRVAILRHKAAQWRDVSLPTVLDVLDALKVLASAPANAR